MGGQKAEKRAQSKGKCSFCNQLISKSGMRAHLEACKARKTVLAGVNKARGAKSAQFFHLAIEGKYAPEYWLHIEIPADFTLTELDYFLRDIWLECCGHLSQFRIGKTDYVGQPDEDAFEEMFEQEGDESADTEADDVPPPPSPDIQDALETLRQLMNSLPPEFHIGFDELEEADMDVPLKEVLKPDTKFSHEYDFGSTTELKLTAVSLYDSKIVKGDKFPLRIMARNEAPEFKCDVCGKPATLICPQPIGDGEGFLCNDHAKECDLEMLLPVVNSPRAGVCGYTGEAPDNWNFWEYDSDYAEGDEFFEDDEFDDEDE